MRKLPETRVTHAVLELMRHFRILSGNPSYPQIAEATGIQKARVGNIFRGSLKRLKLDELERLCVGIGITEMQLLAALMECLDGGDPQLVATRSVARSMEEAA